jgi:hypothetical protein
VGTRGSISLLTLGIVLFIVGFVGNWAQDSAAPFINLGEAPIGSTVTFDADAREYRVVTSGPTRPRVEQTVCQIELANETTERKLGGSGGVNPRDAMGVGRVLEFDATPGTTRVTCNDRFVESSTHGRFQVVASDGLVSKAILGAFILGGVAFAGGALGLFLLYRREQRRSG